MLKNRYQITKLEWSIIGLSILLLSIGFLPPTQNWISLIYGSTLFRILSIVFLFVWVIVYRLSLFHEGEQRISFDFQTTLTYLLPLIAFLSLILLPAQRLEDPPWGSGDSLYLAETIPIFSQAFGFLATSNELLELFIRSKLYLLLHNRIGIINSLGLYSYLAGIVHIIAVHLYLMRHPKAWLLPGWLILFFTPTSVLYAGYIENYSMSRALLMSITLLSLTTIETSNRGTRIILIRFITVLASLAVAHHLISGLILPALVYLLYIVAKQEKSPKQFFIKEAFTAIVISVFILTTIFGAFYFTEFRQIVFEDGHIQTHSLRSLGAILTSKTLISIIQILLLYPASLLVLPKLFSKQKSTTVQFLLIAVIPFILFAIIWRPAIGFPADWDLFSYFLIPFSVLTFHQLSKISFLSFALLRASILLSILTIVPGLAWQLWLHQESALTSRNLKYIAHLNENTIPILENSRFIKASPLKQKKTLLSVYLIREKMLYRINELHHESRLQENETIPLTKEINSLWFNYLDNKDNITNTNQGFLNMLNHFYTIYTTINKEWNQLQ